MPAGKFCRCWERFQEHSLSADTTVYETLESARVAVSWTVCHSCREVLVADAITTQRISLNHKHVCHKQCHTCNISLWSRVPVHYTTINCFIYPAVNRCLKFISDISFYFAAQQRRANKDKERKYHVHDIPKLYGWVNPIKNTFHVIKVDAQQWKTANLSSLTIFILKYCLQHHWIFHHWTALIAQQNALNNAACLHY